MRNCVAKLGHMRGFRVIAHPSQLALFSTGETVLYCSREPAFPYAPFSIIPSSYISVASITDAISIHPPSVQRSMFEKQGIGYMLIEYIDRPQGRMLSETWDEKRDANLETNLFRGLSRVILGIASIPLPRIVSFTIDPRGFLSLSNRPLRLDVQQLENEHIPVDS
ncbi:hypothetical protein C8Q69DRAFT_277488 [Paecilomyces variotii]|uniref:Uncharacterized protein n=1 Tax=Byssochlamys spectabilis TaxID=264951 RepID=A0A443HT43_BYSSP|nr:hypothetical protein C8Q69DRAFT_277488 [Paecilomyces variotii]RWQ94987.1 hypothetical protein C8Q69DRAFT_277488 [Paecilomyces variotii]